MGNQGADTVDRINFCPACGNRLHSEDGDIQPVADQGKRLQPAADRSGLAKIFRSDIGLSIIAYTGLSGWIASILPIVDTSTGLITGAAIGLFRKI